MNKGPGCKFTKWIHMQGTEHAQKIFSLGSSFAVHHNMNVYVTSRVQSTFNTEVKLLTRACYCWLCQ